MTVIALGTFDGVHRGHQKIIKAAVAYAKKHRLMPTAITFDPHPQQLIAPERGLKLLTTLEERQELLHRYGIRRVYVLKFAREIQRLGPDEFIKRVLCERLKAKHVFVGYDFAFGWGRIGRADSLKGHGFKTTIVPPLKRKGHPIKSRRIREELSWGDFNQAVKDLGHAYQISGRIVKGEGRGKRMGFPTINLEVDKDKLLPAYGVYAGRCEIMGRCFPAAINLGSRPSFGPGRVSVEAHLLGFGKNVYGKKAVLYLVKKIRQEKHFSDIQKLKQQIKSDVAKTKVIVL